MSLSILGINQTGPAGILPPGAQFQVPVYFDPSLDGSFEFDVGATSPSDTAESLDSIDWDAIVPSIFPGLTGAANWPAVYAQLPADDGQHLGPVRRPAGSATPRSCPASVGDPGDPIDVLQLAVNQAVAAVSTSMSGDAVGTAPGASWRATRSRPPMVRPAMSSPRTILQDGSFVFPTVTAGSYTFSVPGDLIDGSPAPVTVNAGQAVTGVTVDARPEVTLSGQVTERADSPSPVPSVFVTVRRQGSQLPCK